MIAYALVVVGIVSRFIVHVPNFSPVLAIALFSGMYVDRRYALLLPVVLMVATDIFLGLHSAVAFTWGSVLLISALGMFAGKKRTLGRVALSGLASAVIFFVVSNLGVWLTSGLYEHSLSGISRCYVMAIPFFRMSLVSTVAYSCVLFVLYEGALARVKGTRFATVL